MKKRRIIVSIITLLFVSTVTVFVTTNFNNKKIPKNDVETNNTNKELIPDPVNEDKIDDTQEVEIPVVENENKASDNKKDTNSTNKKPNNNSSSNSQNIQNNDSTNNNSSSQEETPNSNVDVIDEKPLMSWQILDFAISKYGSQSNAFQACETKGDSYAGSYFYFCTDVMNTEGKLIGYMLRLKEFNTGNDFNWR